MNEVVQIWNVYYTNWEYFERWSHKNKWSYNSEIIGDVRAYKKKKNAEKLLDFVNKTSKEILNANYRWNNEF